MLFPLARRGTAKFDADRNHASAATARLLPPSRYGAFNGRYWTENDGRNEFAARLARRRGHPRAVLCLRGRGPLSARAGAYISRPGVELSRSRDRDPVTR